MYLSYFTRRFTTSIYDDYFQQITNIRISNTSILILIEKQGVSQEANDTSMNLKINLHFWSKEVVSMIWICEEQTNCSFERWLLILFQNLHQVIDQYSHKTIYISQTQKQCSKLISSHETETCNDQSNSQYKALSSLVLLLKDFIQNQKLSIFKSLLRIIDFLFYQKLIMEQSTNKQPKTHPISNSPPKDEGLKTSIGKEQEEGISFDLADDVSFTMKPNMPQQLQNTLLKLISNHKSQPISQSFSYQNVSQIVTALLHLENFQQILTYFSKNTLMKVYLQKIPNIINLKQLFSTARFPHLNTLELSNNLMTTTNLDLYVDNFQSFGFLDSPVLDGLRIFANPRQLSFLKKQKFNQLTFIVLKHPLILTNQPHSDSYSKKFQRCQFENLKEIVFYNNAQENRFYGGFTETLYLANNFVKIGSNKISGIDPYDFQGMDPFYCKKIRSTKYVKTLLERFPLQD